jgi:serine protease Do
LQPGDIITAVETQKVTSALAFYRAILDLGAGDQTEFSVHRGDEDFTVTLTLADASNHRKTDGIRAWELFGLELKPIPAAEFRRRFNTQYRGGLLVSAVRAHSPAADTGIRRGDVLVGMHIWETVKSEDVAYIINHADFSSLLPIKFFLLRGRETLYGFLPVATTKTAQR